MKIRRCGEVRNDSDFWHGRWVRPTVRTILALGLLHCSAASAFDYCGFNLATNGVTYDAGATNGSISVMTGCEVGVLPWAVGASYIPSKCEVLTLSSTTYPPNYVVLSLGGSGTLNYKDNIVNGYPGMLCVGQCVDTEPGVSFGPTKQGLDQRLAGLPPYTCTAESLPPDNKRTAVIPVAESLDISGRKQVCIVGFWVVVLNGYDNATHGVSVTFISSLPAGGDDCTWTATNDVDWLTITGGSTGNGTGTVCYSVQPNTGPARSGTITAAGQTFTVSQGASDTDGDGIPDWWMLQYFGHLTGQTNDNSSAQNDADGTGQNNLFKYVAGLDPTNPASIFLLNILNATDHPGQMQLTFAPVVAGRAYLPEFTTDLTGGSYTPLTGYSGPQTNSTEVSITDLNATQPSKFYRIRVSFP